MKLLLLAAGLTLVATSPVPAQAEGVSAEDATKVVCRRMQATGTLVRKRKLCMTQAKWEEYFAANRETVEGMREGICAGSADKGLMGCGYFDDLKSNDRGPG